MLFYNSWNLVWKEGKHCKFFNCFIIYNFTDSDTSSGRVYDNLEGWRELTDDEKAFVAKKMAWCDKKKRSSSSAITKPQPIASPKPATTPKPIKSKTQISSIQPVAYPKPDKPSAPSKYSKSLDSDEFDEYDESYHSSLKKPNDKG